MDISGITIRKLVPKDSALHGRFFSLLKKEFPEVLWITKNTIANGKVYVLLKDSELIGGLTLFENSPESIDIIKEAEIRLNGRSSIFGSCFTIIEKYRRGGYGLFLAKEILQKEVFSKQKIVWGVFKKHHLIHFYKKHFDCEIYPLPSNLNLVIFTNISSATN